MAQQGKGRIQRVTPSNRAAKKKRVLELIAQGATQAYAAQEVGVARRTILAWRQQDEKFAVAFNDAQQSKLDKLLEVAFNRAMDPKDPRGDILLMFQVKQLDPSFRDNAKIELGASPELATSLTKLAKLAEST